jgi:hypothetical protein
MEWKVHHQRPLFPWFPVVLEVVSSPLISSPLKHEVIYVLLYCLIPLIDASCVSHTWCLDTLSLIVVHFVSLLSCFLRLHSSNHVLIFRWFFRYHGGSGDEQVEQRRRLHCTIPWMVQKMQRRQRRRLAGAREGWGGRELATGELASSIAHPSGKPHLFTFHLWALSNLPLWIQWQRDCVCRCYFIPKVSTQFLGVGSSITSGWPARIRHTSRENTIGLWRMEAGTN